MTWIEWSILVYLAAVCIALGIGAWQESQRVKRLREEAWANELDVVGDR